jgi:hypothetical protein
MRWPVRAVALRHAFNTNTCAHPRSVKSPCPPGVFLLSPPPGTKGRYKGFEQGCLTHLFPNSVQKSKILETWFADLTLPGLPFVPAGESSGTSQSVHRVPEGAMGATCGDPISSASATSCSSLLHPPRDLDFKSMLAGSEPHDCPAPWIWQDATRFPKRSCLGGCAIPSIRYLELGVQLPSRHSYRFSGLVPHQVR